MKILQLCNKIPFPPRDGGCVAINRITEGLIENGHSVHVLAMETHKHPFDAAIFPEHYIRQTNFEHIYMDTRVRALPAFLNLFSSSSYNVNRFYSGMFEKKLVEILEKNTFDIIHLESLYLSPYTPCIRKHSAAKLVLRAHNIEYRIWEQLAASASNPLQKIYLYILARKLKRYEETLFKTYDGIAAITEEDKQSLLESGCRVPSGVFPAGIDFTKIPYDPSYSPSPGTVFHLGAMDWQPNLRGVRWFTEQVWPRIAEKNPKASLHLAGKSMPASLRDDAAKKIYVAGEVADAYAFMKSNNIMVVPLFSGSGMRVKIVEGMALGKTIISTSAGAIGIDYKKNEHILIADTAEEFVSAIQKCLNDPAFCSSIGKNARKQAEEKYDNKKIITNLVGFYKSLLS